ncbi:hypothetical protein C2W64_04398 [Brevibacillus laterosporus]|nr:hypothetical protein C2W64_04398 [Brevibacillus laterosporus]
MKTWAKAVVRHQWLVSCVARPPLVHDFYSMKEKIIYAKVLKMIG